MINRNGGAHNSKKGIGLWEVEYSKTYHNIEFVMKYSELINDLKSHLDEEVDLHPSSYGIGICN